MRSHAIFVTGTDTDAGKTWVTVALLRALRNRGIDAVGIKPIECGGREDSSAILMACTESGITIDEVNPLTFPHPLAPAAQGGEKVDFSDLAENIDSLRKRHSLVLIEGAGGWIVPVDGKRTMADLAIEIGAEVLLVTANRLGALNHTLLTTRAIDDCGLDLAAVFLNSLPDQTNVPKDNHAILTSHLPNTRIISDDLSALVEHLLNSP